MSDKKLIRFPEKCLADLLYRDYKKIDRIQHGLRLIETTIALSFLLR